MPGKSIFFRAVAGLALMAAGILSACSGSDGAATATPPPTFVPTPVLTIAPVVRTQVATSQTATAGAVQATRASAAASATPGVWMALPGVVRGAASSTASVILPDGRVRTYLLSGGSLAFVESVDGTSLSGLTPTTVLGGRAPGSLGTVSDPAVLRLDSGKFLLIFDLQEKPGQTEDRRLYAAVSDDGVNFGPNRALPVTEGVDRSKLAGNIVQSAPDLVQLPDGGIRVYYSAGDYAIASMTSRDGGARWSQDPGYRLAAEGKAFVDPDVTVDPDGSFSMYFAYSEFEPECGYIGCQRLRTASSQDGLDWESGDEILRAAFSSRRMTGPDVIEFPDGHMVMLYGIEGVRGRQDLYAAVKK